MKKRFLGVTMAVFMFLGLGLTAMAEEDKPEATKPEATKAEEAAKPAEAPAPSPELLMSILGKAGLAAPLDKAGINIYGYAEAGFMHTFNGSPNDGPTFIGFNSYKDTPILDKISLNVERTVDPAKKMFDLGFHLEGIWGSDAAFIHSNGIGDTQTGRNQWDLLQAYLDVAIPGLPMKIRAGKWIELAGFEHFSSNIYGAFGDPARALYTYSYQFLYAEPGTQTGVLLSYILNPKWSFDVGFTRGWNQSTLDANDAPDFLGRLPLHPMTRPP